MDLRPGLAHSGGVSHITRKLLIFTIFFQRILNIFMVFSFNGIVSRQILYLAEGDRLGLATDILTVNGVYDITLCIRPL